MTAHTSGTTVPPAAGAGGRDLHPLIRLARWPLLVASVLLALASWLTTPLDASLGSLTQDLTEGTVTEVVLGCEVGEAESGFRLHIGTLPPEERADVCWVTESGLSYGADVPEGPTRQGSRGRLGRVGSDASIWAVIERVDQSVLDADGRLWTETVHDVCNVLGLAIVALLLACLVLGPQPRRLTKWGTFWVLLMPAGLGPVWLLAREAPWDRNLHQLPEPPPRWRGDIGGGIRRHGGWTGFALLLIVAILVSGVSELLRDQLSRLDPPMPPSVGG
uniref:Uncharacterized protein n=1 Tax=uncultured Nocardioidaceae bacterium TaxID=253824 RepID=A0A6J4M787_9ACTN|nr:MAG: hypothetical protein AVDCRST_MAG46-2552 [uncultured Nocardioidaceae bacterium]